MNKIFKVVWNKSKNCYVVVSEFAKNNSGKKKIVVAGIFAALAMTNANVALRQMMYLVVAVRLQLHLVPVLVLQVQMQLV